ncbi:MAG: hypothetical protein GX442_26335 [Candidatus Riflebacteria bacterium]|nr:hypothetical protein [Candidatus Riflebacteria bacterium]
MRIRYLGFLVLFAAAAVILTGCGNDPDKNFQKGKYAEAYPEFIKRAGTNEVALKNEVANGTFDSRQKAGNQALHDLYYAAECQKRLGNTQEAATLFQRVVGLSQYQIRIPQDRSAILKDGLSSLLSAAREVRRQEVSYGQALEDWENDQSSGNTDPYDNGGSNTDPYDNGGSNTDPYDNGGSNTDPYSNGGSNTDPYSNGGSNTDPYNSRTTNNVAKAASTAEAPSRFWLDNAVSTLRSRQRDFEKKLYETTPQQVPDIAKVKAEYDKFSRLLDNYMSYASPGGIFFRPDSLFSQMAWQSFESGADSLQRVTYAAQGNITYISQPLQLKEPQLVEAAKAALQSMGQASAPATPASPAGAQSTSGTTGVTVNTEGNSPFGQ